MNPEQFEQIVAQEFPGAIPEKFRPLIRNVAFVVEDEPSDDVRAEEGLEGDETLLGYYRGVPTTARGDMYGIGGVLPDSIVLYQLPIEEEAEFLCTGNPALFEDRVRKVVRETIWHEVAHHFGMDEEEVARREAGREE